MNDDKYTITSGYLDVDNGHKIYYQQWGNQSAPAIFCLHGGPGSHSKQKHKIIFDPDKQHVVFFDQRGSGQSMYDNLLEENNTHALVEDIEKLRKHLGFETIQMFGYSWGSTLALCYALKHSKKITKLLVGGIYLGTESETNYLYENGGIGQFSPEAWEYFQEIVPKSKRSNKLAYYYKQLLSNDLAVKLDHLRRWSQLEASIMSFDADYESIRISTDNDADIENMNGVIIASHYFVNNCFIPDDYILDNLDKIKNMPTVVVQGRFDGVCPPEAAYNLSKGLGENCHLHIVPSSHAREGALREALKAYVWAFLD